MGRRLPVPAWAGAYERRWLRGDVLAGAISGVRARGTSSAQAACWGTHLHAAAADRLASRLGPLGFLARELADELPALMLELGT